MLVISSAFFAQLDSPEFTGSADCVVAKLDDLVEKAKGQSGPSKEHVLDCMRVALAIQAPHCVQRPVKAHLKKFQVWCQDKAELIQRGEMYVSLAYAGLLSQLANLESFVLCSGGDNSALLKSLADLRKERDLPCFVANTQTLLEELAATEAPACGGGAPALGAS